MRVPSICITSLLGLIACTGTDVGNPIVDLDATLYERNADAGTFYEGYMSLAMVGLDYSSGCGSREELIGSQPVEAQLVETGTSPAPPLLTRELPTQHFCTFGLMLTPSSDDSGRLPLGTSFSFIGVLGNGTNFEIVGTDTLPITLTPTDASSTFTVLEEANSLVVAVAEDDLLVGIDFGSAEVDPDDVIRISGDSNADLLSEIESNFAQAVRLFDDDNDDGLLGTDESGDDDILAGP